MLPALSIALYGEEAGHADDHELGPAVIRFIRSSRSDETVRSAGDDPSGGAAPARQEADEPRRAHEAR